MISDNDDDDQSNDKNSIKNIEKIDIVKENSAKNKEIRSHNKNKELEAKELEYAEYLIENAEIEKDVGKSFSGIDWM